MAHQLRTYLNPALCSQATHLWSNQLCRSHPALPGESKSVSDHSDPTHQQHIKIMASSAKGKLLVAGMSPLMSVARTPQRHPGRNWRWRRLLELLVLPSNWPQQTGCPTSPHRAPSCKVVQAAAHTFLTHDHQHTQTSKRREHFLALLCHHMRCIDMPICRYAFKQSIKL